MVTRSSNFAHYSARQFVETEDPEWLRQLDSCAFTVRTMDDDGYGRLLRILLFNLESLSEAKLLHTQPLGNRPISLPSEVRY